MRTANIVCALAILVWGGLMLRESLQVSIGWEESGPAAGFFPFWLSVGLIVCATVVVLQASIPRLAREKEEKPFFPPGSLPSLLKVVLPVAAMLLAIEVVGFYVAGALYLTFSMRWIGRHSWLFTAAVAALFPLAIWMVIERWFFILLPKGMLGAILPF